jgi:hypothetical protein
MNGRVPEAAIRESGAIRNQTHPVTFTLCNTVGWREPCLRAIFFTGPSSP